MNASIADVQPQGRLLAFRMWVVACMLLLSYFVAPHTAFAGRNGIQSDGRDFYVGYMPGIRHTTSAWSNVFETYYVLVGSYTDGNVVTISYFDQTSGNEYAGPTFVVNKGRTTQQVLDMNHMGPSRPGEVLQYCAAHITSKYPVSVQCYSQGSSAGGLLQSVPTPALGKKYVIASWYDNPIQNNPGFINRDSSSGEFMVIAAFDNTVVTYTPASTTYAGIVGVSSGNGSDGTPHPTTVVLKRGQVYWVRSLSVDASFDISGSTVTADKPVAVIAGHERALLGDPSGIWHSLDNDVRDVMIEQMTPVEDWETEYSSIPMVPPPAISRLLVNGTGEMYRVYTNDPNGGAVDGWIGGLISPYTYALSQFQNPIVSYDNITDPIDLVCHDGKKMYVVEYDYFQGQHDSDPGEKVGKGGIDIKTQSSGGGTTVQDETTYKMPSEMNVVPVNRFRKNAVWKVPTQSNYRGYQWINVISRVDSFRTVQMSYNGAAYKPLLSYPKTGPFPIPLHPELAGYQFQLPAGDYAAISDNSPFVVYSYGRTQTEYKDGWAYAAPCGEAYGSGDSSAPPQMTFTPLCGGWNLVISDSSTNDEGIADIELLNDPQGVYARPARVSYNVSLNPTNLNFVVGDPVVKFQVLVNNPLQDAYAAVYVVDRAGNDSVFEFRYTAPKLATSPTAPSAVSMLLSNVGTPNCSRAVLYNKIGSATLVVDSATFRFNKGDFTLSSTVPAIPATLKPGDSIVAYVCYTASDTGTLHSDSLIFSMDCIRDTVPLLGSGATPIIVATDADFGSVLVGRTVCKNVTVRNIGNAPLILDTNWVLHNITNFKFNDASKLPVTLLPGQSIVLNFCYTATAVGYDSTTNDWGTNLGGEFLHHNKDYSILTGRGTKPGVLWDRNVQLYSTVCDAADTVRMYLYNNTDPNNGGATITIASVQLTGATYPGEFTIVNDQLGQIPMNDFPLAPGDSVWVDVAFQASLANGFANRTVTLIANVAAGTDTSIHSPVVLITATVTHADLTVSNASLDFGLVSVGVPVTMFDTISNPGTAPLVITSLSMTDTAFNYSGVQVGDTIPPGGKRIVTIVGEIGYAGSATGDFNVVGLSNCTPKGLTVCSIATNSLSVATRGDTAQTIYTCQSDTLWVLAKNKGTRTVILQSAQIVNSGVDTEAAEFDFASSQAGSVSPNDTLTAGESVLIPVIYHPSLSQTSSAQVVFTFDTVLNSVWQLDSNQIVGTASNIDLTTSVANTGGQPYSVQTGGLFDVPITISQALPTQAQVYGYQVQVSWRDDLFEEKGGSVRLGGIDLDYGTLSPGTVENRDAQGNHILTLIVQGNTPLTSITTLATLHFQLMVAKDLQSSFTIGQALFLDKDSNLVCYIQNAKVNGTFVPQDLCGDSTTRNFLRNGVIQAGILNIVPNPASSSTAITYEVHESKVPITIEVYDMLGNCVQTLFKDVPHEIGVWRATMDASVLPSGVYMLRFATPNASTTRQVIVNK